LSYAGGMNEHVALKRPVADDLYGADFYAWLQSQADLLRRRRFDRLDLENIIEEIDSLGREQIHSVESLSFAPVSIWSNWLFPRTSSLGRDGKILSTSSVDDLLVA
jgi:hypothetical protein